MTFDLIQHLERQMRFSQKIFGPGARVNGVLDHMRKELDEVKREPSSLEEWIDLVILALDGAWRAGFSPEEICKGLVDKQTKNENRQWPDWRELDGETAIEHIREVGGWLT